MMPYEKSQSSSYEDDVIWIILLQILLRKILH